MKCVQMSLFINLINVFEFLMITQNLRGNTVSNIFQEVKIETLLSLLSFFTNISPTNKATFQSV